MIKIKFIEGNIHRNETTFRPWIAASYMLKEIGIEITESDDFDYAIIGHASIIDKKVSLKQAIDQGLNFLNRITGDYIIFDGQDSTSLIGTVDVLRESSAKLFLKINYLNDKSLYKNKYINGRYYWGLGGNYSVPDIDTLLPKMKLSGTNWVNTYMTDGSFPVYPYTQNKKYDIAAMFQFPLKNEVIEHGLLQTPYYNKHREGMFNIITSDKYNSAKLIDGQRLTEQEYYQKMYDSKIVLAPFGFGELPPRDIQSAQFGSVLVKPDVSYIETKPNIYVDNETYISVKHDWSDLEEKLDYILENYKELQKYLVENMRKKFIEEYSHENLVRHIYDIFKNMEGIE